VFGSVARGDADEASDVGILVDLEPGRSLFDLVGLLMGLRKSLGRDVAVVTRAGLRPRIRDRVLTGGNRTVRGDRERPPGYRWSVSQTPLAAWVTPSAYNTGDYTKTYHALRHWLASEYSFLGWALLRPGGPEYERSRRYRNPGVTAATEQHRLVGTSYRNSANPGPTRCAEIS
jgi:predicted nucleotidyltransferase